MFADRVGWKKWGVHRAVSKCDVSAKKPIIFRFSSPSEFRSKFYHQSGEWCKRGITWITTLLCQIGRINLTQNNRLSTAFTNVWATTETESSSSPEYVFYVFFQISKNAIFRYFNWHLKKLKVVSTSLVKVSSQLRFGFTLNVLLVIICFSAVVNQVFIAE